MNDIIINLQHMLTARDMAMVKNSSQDSKDEYDYYLNSVICEIEHLIGQNEELEENFNNLVISHDLLIKENELIAHELYRLMWDQHPGTMLCNIDKIRMNIRQNNINGFYKP